MSPGHPITRLLVANRGEIALRILRSAQAAGIHSVAVYSDGDATAPFVRAADGAVALGGRTAAESYLDGDKLLEAARRSGADAVHPGYGFLSENAEFARRVGEAGLVWVGPPPEAIAAMGDKLAARRAVERAGVATLPAEELTADGEPEEAAARLGLPLLVKAAGGGGGRGMRRVEHRGELAGAIASARREAAATFGDDRVYLERLLSPARHVEIQILGDRHGNLVHCFERECSVQRRHQKLIEEAPSSAVTPELRERMGAAALSAAKSIGYVSAGTVEFLLEMDGEDFFFLEMNTRLQVEHPVTEAVCGIDLVREQLRIAQGESLGFAQGDLSLSGFAIEARLCAEDPGRDFLPSPGRILAWAPPADPPARVDSGIETGSEVSVDFDPLLAKLIVHAPTRREAALRLARVLEKTRVQGVATNRDLLVATLRHHAFLSGDTPTDFLEREAPARTRAVSVEELRRAAIAAAMTGQAGARSGCRVLTTLPSGWRNTPMPPEVRSYRYGSRHRVSVRYRRERDGRFRVWVDADEYRVRVHGGDEQHVDLEIDGYRARYDVAAAGARRWVHGPEGDLELEAEERFPEPEVATASGGLLAPLPGKVLSVAVAVGEEVSAGQLLLVLEAMKIEHPIRAPHPGRVTALPVRAGDQVEGGTLLAALSEEGGQDPS